MTTPTNTGQRPALGGREAPSRGEGRALPGAAGRGSSLRTGCRIIVSVVLISVMAPISAWADTMRCSLVEYGRVTIEGKVDGEVLLDEHMAEVIIVDLESGKVSHPLLGNEFFENRELLDSGSDVSSFKVLGYSPVILGTDTARNTTYLEIRTWEEGPLKPFIVVEDGFVGTGVCK